MFNNRRKMELTIKKQKTIVAILVIISVVLLIIFYKNMGFLTKNIIFKNEEKTIALAFVLILVPSMIGLLAYNIVGLDKTKIIEQVEQVKTYLRKYINNEYFTEVFVKYPNNITSREEMFKSILQEGEYKFYAMFTPDDNISFSVRDKNDVEVYSIVYDNPIYFCYNFTFKEEEQKDV